VRPHRFAEGTSVPVSRSREELQNVLERAGALEVGFVTGAGGRARCAFRLKSSGLLIALEVPEVDPLSFKPGPRDSTRWEESVKRRVHVPGSKLDQLVEAERRRRWRALLLVVKAKLEAIASGISTIDGEFMAGIVLASGRTLEAELRPRLKELAASGAVPSLLPESCGASGGGR
jgi:hypothetical protein